MLQIGELIENRYRVLYQIGKGGYSNVYLVLNEKANKQWAIKEVQKSADEQGQAMRQNLIAETEILKHLKHPHLPSIVDILNREDDYLIVMDYIEGRTLRKILKDKGHPLPQNLVVDWSLQVCDVFQYLHSQNPPIIYRDTKPSNLMLKPDGNIVLIDFGTARVYQEDKSEDTTCLGTHAYAAPEQFGHGRQTDARTDIYNLGATMYQLLTMHTPSGAGCNPELMKKWNPDLASGLIRIIQKCMAPEPEDRYQTDAELIFDLSHYQALDTREVRKRKKRFAAFLTVSLLAIACFVMSGISTAAIRQQASQSYTHLVESAQMQQDSGNKADLYIQAIRSDPSKAEAYQGLLDTYLSDGNLSSSESDQLLSVLGYQSESSSDQTLNTLEKQDKAAYDQLGYQIGLAYFYYYDGSGSKPLSKVWFSIAKDSATLSEAQKERSSRFYLIASYYDQLSRTDKAGDSTVSYKEYWDDLDAACGDDIMQSDNVMTALVIYREMTWQISSHALEFKNAGVTEKEMTKVLDDIESRLADEIEKSPQYSTDEARQIDSEVHDNLTSARNAVSVTFAQEAD